MKLSGKVTATQPGAPKATPSEGLAESLNYVLNNIGALEDAMVNISERLIGVEPEKDAATAPIPTGIIDKVESALRRLQSLNQLAVSIQASL